MEIDPRASGERLGCYTAIGGLCLYALILMMYLLSMVHR